MSFEPVIIVGAGRSGTNMLRDLLTQLPGIVTWPCDEINYIWRHGNVTFPTDEFTSKMATLRTRRFINRAFDRLGGPNVTHVVEKTCANSLRVDFVDAVVPNAKYLYLVRDGRDVAVSASKRWTAPLDYPYVLRKARFVPKTDLPYYAVRYLASRFHRLLTKERRLSTWGPRYVGMDDTTAPIDLLELCILQWEKCVQRSDESFAKINPSRVCQLRYEDFVGNPVVHLHRIVSFLGIEVPDSQITKLVSTVSARSVGAAQRSLACEKWEALTGIVSGTLLQHDYAVPEELRKAA